MSCLNCGENDYAYVGIDEEGEDLIACLGCYRVQHFAQRREDGIVQVDDDGYSSVPSAGDDDGRDARTDPNFEGYPGHQYW